MPEEQPPSARQRFVRDLRRIRENREVSRSRIHEATQVPVSHVEAFEEGTLYEQSRMNPIYLKAFVRAYAETIGISPEPVIDHLQSALEGEYANQLAVQHLNEPPAEEGSAEVQDTVSASEASSAADGPAESPTEGEHADSAPVSGPEASAENQSPSSDPSPSTASPPGDAVASPTGRRSSADDGPARPSRGAASQFVGLWARHRNTILTVALGLLLVGVLGGVLGRFFGGSGTPSEPSNGAEAGGTQPAPATEAAAAGPVADSTVQDSSAAEAPSDRPPPADLVLGDTLHLTVWATSIVQRMHVQQDDDLRRPYWIEEGDARVYPFTRRIIVQDRLDSLRLYLEGYPYPTTRTDAEGRIVIRRDTAQQFADTLRGAPASLPVSPDTIPIRAPSPPTTDDTTETSGGP